MPGPKFNTKRAEAMERLLTRKKDPLTYAQVGEQYGVTPQRVVQIIRRLRTGTYSTKGE